MKHLIVKRFGPLCNADIELDRVNVIFGVQSSGKSSILRIASFCSWVEKRIMLLQSSDYFEKENCFIEHLLNYYGMGNYLKQDSYIEYSTTYLKFAFDNAKPRAKFSCKTNRSAWRYCRPKVSYITSDRNVVSLFKDYKGLSNVSPHLQEFMEEWDVSRRSKAATENVLNLGINYHFDSTEEKDLVVLKSGKELELAETSSGIQSLMPLFVHTDYLLNGIFDDEKKNLQNLSLNKVAEIKHTFDIIYNRCIATKSGSKKVTTEFYLNSKLQSYLFSTEEEREKFNGYVNRLLKTDHSEIFLEEPENNLFPPTQYKFINWILDRLMAGDRKHTIFVTTHSPYVLNQMLEYRPKDFRLYMTRPIDDDQYDVVSFSEDMIEDTIYNGVDLFFNFEAYL